MIRGIETGNAAVNWLEENAALLRFLILISLSLVWCACLIAIRTLWTQNFDYLFLVWNLALGATPLVWSVLFVIQRNLYLRITTGALWLLFFPNAAYLTTDFFHLRNLASGPIWLDTLMLASCAATGLMMGYFSLQLLQDHLLFAKRAFLGWSVAIGSLVLSGFGIYLGRILRWRSIDLFLSPMRLLGDVVERIVNPLLHIRAWGMTLGFAIFLLLGYSVFRTLARFTVKNAGSGL